MTIDSIRRSLTGCSALTILVFALTPASVFGQTTGAISGTVNVHIPVAVAAYTATADPADATFVKEVITDESHQYTIGGLAPGAYYVRTRIADPTNPFAESWYKDVFVAAAGARPWGVTVTAGATTSGIDFTPSSLTGRITGTLTLARLPFKGPMTLPSVEIYNATGTLVRVARLGPAGPDASAGGVLDTDPPAGGTWPWTAAGLPGGVYYVKTSSVATPAPNTGHVGPTGGWWVDEAYDNIPCVAADCLATRGTPITVTAGANGSGTASPASVDISLDYGAVITGDTVNSVFATGRIEVYDARGVLLPRRAATIALTFGRSYFASGLPPGTYFVLKPRDPQGEHPATLYKDIPCDGCAVTSGTPVTVAAGETRTGIDFVDVPKGAIRGTVRTSGSVASQVTIRLYTGSGQPVATAVSAADGTYAFTALAPGAYYLQTMNALGFVDEIYDNLPCSGCEASRGAAVNVAANTDTTGIDFDLAPGVAVSGLVQAVLPVSGPSWPIGGVGIRFYTPQNTLAGRAVSDVAGRYSITLSAGTYYAISDAAPGYMRRLYVNGQCVSGVCPFDTGTPIVVTSVAVPNIDFPLTQCAAAAIAPVTLASPAVGVAYRQKFTTNAGDGGLPYEVSAGMLPPGLLLNPVFGVLSGTPTAAGRYTFTIATGTCAAARTYTLDVPACVLDVPSAVASRATGEPFLLPVSTTCPSWSVSSNDAWISVEQVANNNPPAVRITVSPYTGATPRRGSIVIGSRVVTVYQNGTTPQPPFGSVDTPINGAALSGSFAIGGWALDDLAVQRVQIYRAPVAGEHGDVFIGDATLVEGARPDVEAVFPNLPGVRRAGFGYLLLSNMLPNGGNGTFTFDVYADDVDGNRTFLGARTVTVTNSTATGPFGAIDTPGQGETISGSAYINFGWALTPQPRTIPFDGSTIDVVIDGVSLGHVTAYGGFRPDVSTLFPGLNNSPGPIGYRTIDTTALSEGVHTIAWGVTDDGGQASGIGSRYFTVRNSAWVASQQATGAPAQASGGTASPNATTSAVEKLLLPPKIDGVDLGRQAASIETLPLDPDGTRRASLSSQRWVAIDLSTGNDACAPRYEGYLVAAGELRPLPIGSSLDAGGVFSWQPGPAFHGTYRLLFVRTSCGLERERVPLTVTIR